nr:ribonuclease H-like domain-containing protein [Tanacetum cinerariifolium]
MAVEVGENPSKDKRTTSGYEENSIDQYDPLLLHSNDTNEETYSKQDTYVIFNMHYKIHSLSQSGSALLEYYHKFNALKRQYDSLVNLPDCICENSKKLKNHNQLLKLMQFLMGLDEVYASIRSITLTTDPIPDVKGAFATLSRDESHRSTQSHNVSIIGNGNYAFVARNNTRSNNWSNSNNNHNKRLNRPILLCTHCNMNGHTADRCFELVEYPLNFKKIHGSNQSGSSNAAIPSTKDQPFVSSNTFTDEQFKRLMAPINEKSISASILANVVDVSKVNMTMGRPNGTKGVVTHIGSLRLTDKISTNDVLVVLDYHVSLLSMHKLSKDNKDKECEISEGIDPISSEGTENTGDTIMDEGEHPDDSAPSKAVSDIEKNVTHEVNDNESEGDNSYY